MIKELKGIDKSIFLFFVFGTLFITVRLLLFGSAASTSIFQYAFSVLPEMFALGIFYQYFLKIYKNEQVLSFNRYDWMMILFIIGNVLVGFVLGKDLKLGVYGFRMTYLPMLFYFLASSSFSPKEQILRMLHYVFVWIGIISVAGIFIYLVFPEFNIEMLGTVSKIIPKYAGFVRLTSLFWTPVVFGSITMVGTLYFLYKSFESKSYWNYIFQFVLIASTFMSISRGPIIILYMGIVILCVLGRKWKSLFFSLGLTALFLSITALSMKSTDRITTWFKDTTVSTMKMEKGVVRVDLLTTAIQEVKENPFGRGLGKSGHVATRFYKASDKKRKDLSIVTTDCWYIKLISETGVMAFLFYVYISIYLFIESIKYLRKNQFDFYGFLFTIFIIINIQNLLSNVLDFYFLSYLYWFLIGLMVYYLKSNKRLEKA